MRKGGLGSYRSTNGVPRESHAHTGLYHFPDRSSRARSKSAAAQDSDMQWVGGKRALGWDWKRIARALGITPGGAATVYGRWKKQREKES